VNTFRSEVTCAEAPESMYQVSGRAVSGSEAGRNDYLEVAWEVVVCKWHQNACNNY
jgi:hypothetical protein